MNAHSQHSACAHMLCNREGRHTASVLTLCTVAAVQAAGKCTESHVRDEAERAVKKRTLGKRANRGCM